MDQSIHQERRHEKKRDEKLAEWLWHCINQLKAIEHKTKCQSKEMAEATWKRVEHWSRLLQH